MELINDLSGYPKLLTFLHSPLGVQMLPRLCQTDLYFLLRYGLKRIDAEHPWIFARCREVQAAPDGYLDLWARGHFKSSIITFALTIQNLLNDPELTVGIFSHTRPIAKGFLRQLMRELAGNEDLKSWFPDILWADPKSQAPKWSEDDGIVLKRKGNPKESTVEAHGLVDGQPTSKHYRLMVYDDVVTRESVTTPDMIAKVTEAWELSRNLTADGGRTRYIGTRYHFADTYAEILRRGAARARIYPATVDGSVEGEPVLLSAMQLAEKRREQGAFTFAAQMLLNPTTDETQGFKFDWIRYHKSQGDFAGFNKYILCDPASAKKRQSDYTAIIVIGLGNDANYYVLDILRDRLSLTERADALFFMHKRWRPKVVGYERYGMMADIEHIKDRQSRENYRFDIVELGGSMPKLDRIRRLIPLFEQGRMYFPETVYRTNYEGKTVELVQTFIEEEFKPFPVGLHDDLLDAMARILDEDMHTMWPKQIPTESDRYARKGRAQRAGSWMSQ